MKKIWYALMLSLILTAVLGAVPVFAASAKSGVVSMCDESVDFGSDTYDKLDVTGDAAPDTVAVDVTETSRVLKVNGQAVKTWKGTSEIPSFKLVTVAGKTFLEVTEENVSKKTSSCGLYLISGGKLKKAFDYAALVNKKLLVKGKYVSDGDNFDMITVDKVKGNTLFLTASLSTKSLGYFKIQNLKLKYSGGKFKLAAAAGKTKCLLMDMKTGKQFKSFTAKKALTVYKKAGSKKKAGFKIAANKTFEMKKAAVVKKNIYVQVRSAGKTGWLKLDKSNMVKMGGILMWG